MRKKLSNRSKKGLKRALCVIFVLLPVIVDLCTSGSVSQFLANHFSLHNIYGFNICWFAACLVIYYFRKYIYFVSAFLFFLLFFPWAYSAFKNLSSADEKYRVKSVSRLKIGSKLFSALRKHISNMMCEHVRILTATEEYRRSYPNSPSQDVQDILDFHSMDPDVSFENLSTNYNNHVNLSDAFLRGVRLSGRLYLGFDFLGADLSGANFDDSVFMTCSFNDCKLAKSQFAKSRLISSNFFGADLSQSVFSQADFFSIRLVEANLQHADFSGATFLKVDFENACLDSATLPPSIKEEGVALNLPSLKNVKWSKPELHTRQDEFLKKMKRDILKCMENLSN